MPGIPNACLGPQQDVQNLVNDAQQLRADALNAVGPVAWQKLSQLGLTSPRLRLIRSPSQASGR